MATPTRQWVRIAILAILCSTLAMAHKVKPPKAADLDHAVKPPKPDDLDHAVKPPKPAVKLRKLQMDTSGEDQSSQTDGAGASASGCGGNQAREEGGGGGGGGIYGGGHGSGGTTFGFHKINPFPAFPFGAFVPEVSTWGEGGGYGGVPNANSGKGVQCHCSNGYAMQYTMSPLNFPPMGIVDRDGPDDMAPSSSP